MSCVIIFSVGCPMSDAQTQSKEPLPSQESKVQCFQEYRGILDFHDLVHLGF